MYPVSEKLYDSISDQNEIRKMVTLYVTAPILCEYVLWVLSDALESGKSKLYFLARDGYSMYQVAAMICAQLELPIECRYLYCSRYAWRAAEYHLLGDRSLEYICLGGIDVTFEKMMYRAGLTEREGKETARLLGREEGYRDPLSYQQVKALKPVLAECSFFQECLQRHSREKYPLVCGYLRQEKLLEGSWAIVDSGWTGSMQKSLQHILKSMGYEGQVEGYYFGMYEYPAEMDKSRYHAWYFLPRKEIRYKVYFSNNLFECICSSPEGMTVGYTWEEDRYVPVLELKESPNREKVEKSIEYLKKYVHLLVGIHGSELLGATKDAKKTAFSLLYYFMGKPTKEEAQEYGSYVFCDDVIGEAAQQVAASLTYEEIKENRVLYKCSNFLRKGGAPIRESAWLEGTIVLVNQNSRSELRHCALYKYVLYLRKTLK